MYKLLLAVAVLFLFSCGKTTQYTPLGALGIGTGLNYHLKNLAANAVLDTFTFNTNNTITEVQGGRYHTFPVSYVAVTQNGLPAVKITMGVSKNVYLDSLRYFPLPPIVQAIGDSVFIIKNTTLPYLVQGNHIDLVLVQY